MKKPNNPFLKKAAGPKPPNRRQMKRGLGTGLDTLLGEAPAKTAATPSVVAPPPVRPAVALASVPPAPPANAVIEVPPLDIERSPWQPRTEFARGRSTSWPIPSAPTASSSRSSAAAVPTASWS